MNGLRAGMSAAPLMAAARVAAGVSSRALRGIRPKVLLFVGLLAVVIHDGNSVRCGAGRLGRHEAVILGHEKRAKCQALSVEE
jgi:hypothetical protein